MSSLKVLLPLVALAPLCSSFLPSHPSIASRASIISAEHAATATVLQASHDKNLFVDRTTTTYKASSFTSTNKNINHDISESTFERVGKVAISALVAMTLSFSAMDVPFTESMTVPSAHAADGKAIGLCLLDKCRVPLAKCITNPNCLANVICINTCNGKADEEGCQVECGNTFENDVVGEFNKCAVSDMTCVPQKQDDGSYPVPNKSQLVQSFNTNLWNGKWYITAGQNKLFDIFDCQVHFFTETEPGKFFGKLNWRIEEPDGEFFTRDAVQEFKQDPTNPAHLRNDGNEYLHYEDDWYIVDYAADNNKEGVPPFAFVYYRGSNDAWVGYGGAVVYTREAKLPESLKPRLREAAKKINNWDFDRDFNVNDNTCKVLDKGEQVLLREKFAGKIVIQTEKQLQQQAVLARTAAKNEVGTIEKSAEKAVKRIEDGALKFEKELIKDVGGVEKEIVKDVVKVEKEIIKDVVAVEEEIVEVEKEIFGDIKKIFGFGK